MISVPIDRIVPLTDARDNFSRLVNDVENITDGLYVLTKGGKPAIALINIKYLEQIMSGRETASGEIPHSKITPTPVVTKPVESPKTTLPNDLSLRTPLQPKKWPEPSFAPAPKTPLSPPLAVQQPNFEVPRNSATPSVNTVKSAELKSPSNYDMKPSVNPTWTGELPKAQQSDLTNTALNTNNAPITGVPNPPPALPTSSVNNFPKMVAPPPLRAEPSLKQPDISLPPILRDDKPVTTSPAPSKPAVNPWPIIPPRRDSNVSPTTAPPPARPDVASTTSSPVTVPPPLAVNNPPLNTNNAPITGVPNQSPALPTPPVNNFPKMVAPPPPPPPSPLPNIPSSFQSVPVPVNGSKPPVGVPTPLTNIAVSLPPPPITSAPAPFSQTAPAVTAPAQISDSKPPLPIAVNAVPAAGIHFDQNPKTILDPGEGMSPLPPTPKVDAPAPSNATTPDLTTPPQSQSAIQDLEI